MGASVNKTAKKYETRNRFIKHAVDALLTKKEIKERERNGEKYQEILKEKGIKLVTPI